MTKEKMLDNLSYKELLYRICDKVYCFEEFGSYQGDWWAKVKYKGKTGWVHGYFGSCAGCDELEAVRDDIYDCLNDEEAQKIYDNAVDEFKRSYLQPEYILSQEEAEKEAQENVNWDMEAQEMVDFIKENSK